METFAHRQLKSLAAAHLRALGCMAVAREVRCPISRFRVDVAGWLDTDPRQHVRCPPRVVVIECKQCRSDFLRDHARIDQLLELRAHLERVKRSIEDTRIKIEEPQLRFCGSSLFESMDDWDFAASRLSSYRKTLRRLRQIDEQLYGQSKFHLMARYRLADQMFIAAPRGMIQPHEVPTGWGLLECSPRLLDHERTRDIHEESVLTVCASAAEQETFPARRLRWLRNIAVAASFASIPRTVTARGTPRPAQPNSLPSR